MSGNLVKDFHKNSSPYNSSVISRSSSQDSSEGEVPSAPAGRMNEPQEEGGARPSPSLAADAVPRDSAEHEEGGATNSPAVVPIPPQNQRVSLEVEAEQRERDTTPLTDRGEGELGAESSAEKQLVPAAKQPLESQGESPLESYEEEFVASGQGEPIPEVGGLAEVPVQETCEDTHHLLAMPREYEYTIPAKVFNGRNITSWKDVKECSEVVHFRFTISLSTDVCQESGQRLTSAVLLIQIVNKKPDCQYKVSARVILYDPTSGTLLRENEEERGFEDGRDHVKFEVGVGLHSAIEQCRSKKLKLQVKIRVQETHHWQNIRIVCPQQPGATRNRTSDS